MRYTLQNRRPGTYWGGLWLVGVIAVSLGCAHQPDEVSWVDWPRFGAPHDGEGLDLHGHTNSLPDFVGPIDGSARLTILTEGNHFPVLLPLVLEEFPAWSEAHGDCAIGAEEILIVTLPQVMVVQALSSGEIRLGNAVLPLRPGGVYPDLVMGGTGPLGRLAARGVVDRKAVVFAKHRGMGLLVRKDHADRVQRLEDLPDAAVRVVVATPNEAGARRQYRTTLEQLLGPAAADRVFDREVPTFPGRLQIQHRDVPYALLTNQADVGLIFGHLADFYARSFPDRLVYVPVEEAAAFGQTIHLARTPQPSDPAAACFERFLMERAATYYPQRGFAAPDTFGYGQELELGATENR